jgi:DNA replication protein DnaC
MNNRKAYLSVVRPERPSRSEDAMTRLGAMITPIVPAKPAPDELKWLCPVCGIVEPQRLPTGRWIKMTCKCQIQARKDKEERIRHQKWLAETRERTFGGWLGKRWVDEEIIEEMVGKTFETYDASRFPDAVKKARAFADNPVGNLLFDGSFGTGKTHLEAAICNYLREVGRLMPDGSRKYTTSLFVSAPQFFTAYQDAMNAPDKTRFISMTDQMTGTPLLVLDDIDKTRPTDFRNDTYFLIFDERYKAKRPTIISTNRKENLSDYLGEAVAFSRMLRGLVTLHMVGDDYRLEEDL